MGCVHLLSISHLRLHKAWIHTGCCYSYFCSILLSMQSLLFIMAMRGPASQSIDIIKGHVAPSNVETVDYLKLTSLCRVSVFPLKILNISGLLWELTVALQGVVAQSLRTMAILLTFAGTWKWQVMDRIGRIWVWRYRKVVSEQVVIKGGSLVIRKVEAQKYSSKKIWDSYIFR